MTKKDIAKTISDIMDMPQQQASEILQAALDTIVDHLATTGQLELRNFGVFKLKTMPPRKLKNPQNGLSVDLPERIKIVFKPGKLMEERVQYHAQRRKQN